MYSCIILNVHYSLVINEVINNKCQGFLNMARNINNRNCDVEYVAVVFE
jgi:hypothetical protein